MSGPTLVMMGRRQLALSNLDKVLYPASGFTKAQVIAYYARVAPVLLPHLKGRAVTLKRYPDGVDGQAFFSKNCPPVRDGDGTGGGYGGILPDRGRREPGVGGEPGRIGTPRSTGKGDGNEAGPTDGGDLRPRPRPAGRDNGVRATGRA